ncbi:MAG TPA: 4-hydroxy-tetrahydrodipicolinate reductase [Candidatus Methanomethylophilaceae archaeon]|nr:4-hydroxy-tetrahydrodipicolinate reductase [Candidatus Methanomethylophilaceae archaeon]
MIKVVVGGATGRLGNIICRLVSESKDMELTGAIVSGNNSNIGNDIFGIKTSGPDSLFRLASDADVYVDVTAPDAAARIVADIPETGCNLIVGTTAIPQDKIDLMASNTAKYNTSSLVTANFAMGVNVFWKMCGILSKYLPDYDIEVIESHHNEKMDSPSGTTAEAIRILKEASGANETLYGREGIIGARGKEIGVHSIRAGDIVGDHTVLFAKNSEVIELTHRAGSRDTFALGCMSSIRWIAEKKDGKVHNMEEVLGIC